MREKKERNKMVLELWKEGKTYKEIAEFFNISLNAVKSILRREKYKEKYHSPLLEGRDFKRELIRKYFNYTCQKCGKVWKPGMRRFDVHHFGRGSKDSRIYDKWIDLNGITLLCHQCHLNLDEHTETMREKRFEYLKSKQVITKKNEKTKK